MGMETCAVPRRAKKDRLETPESSPNRFGNLLNRSDRIVRLARFENQGVGPFSSGPVALVLPTSPGIVREPEGVRRWIMKTWIAGGVL